MRDGLLGRPQGVGCVDGDDRRYERCSAVTAKAPEGCRVAGGVGAGGLGDAVHMVYMSDWLG